MDKVSSMTTLDVVNALNLTHEYTWDEAGRVADKIRQLCSGDYTYPYVLTECDKLIHGFGVETHTENDLHVADFVEVGDLYSATVVMYEDTYYITDMGTIREHWEQDQEAIKHNSRV